MVGANLALGRPSSLHICLNPDEVAAPPAEQRLVIVSQAVDGLQAHVSLTDLVTTAFVRHRRRSPGDLVKERAERDALRPIDGDQR